MESINYQTSTDYKHLAELLRQGKEVVCFYTYDWNHDENDPIMVTDVCTARFVDDCSEEQYHGFSIGCRGVGFLDVRNYMTKLGRMGYGYTLDELFVKMCESRKLTYIEPTL